MLQVFLFERLQRGYKDMADYAASTNIVARGQTVYCSGFTVDKQDAISIKLHFNLLANLPDAFLNVLY